MSAAATAAPAVQEARLQSMQALLPDARLQSMQALLPDARRSLGAGPDAGGSPRIQALQVSAVLRSNSQTHAPKCARWSLCKGSIVNHMQKEGTGRLAMLRAACNWGHPACVLWSFAVQDCRQHVVAGCLTA